MTWDAARPAGSSKIRDGDDAIRANNEALEDALDREHEFPGTLGVSAGYHKLPVGAADPTGASGRLAITNNILKFYSNGAWRHSGFPVGTKMAFYQASAPVGWTQDTGVNDQVLRVVSGSGGSSGGNWTLSGMAVDGHALTVDEIPAHTHGLENTGSSTGSYSRNTGAGTDTATGSTGGGQNHTHGLTNTSWRPAYIDVIVCAKD